MKQSTDTGKQEGNRLIAEFLGWEFVVHETTVLAKFNGEQRWLDNVGFLSEILTSENGYAFHFDWNKLMPVVEKIRTLNPYDGKIWFEYKILYCHCHIWANGINSNNADFWKNNAGTTIEATWETLIQFIQWYNSKNKSQ